MMTSLWELRLLLNRTRSNAKSEPVAIADLEDEKLPLDNTRSERAPRKVVVGVVIPNVLPPKCASAAMEADARFHG